MAAKRPSVRRNRRPWLRRLKRFAWFVCFTSLVLLIVGLAVYIPIYREAVDDAVNIERRLVVQNQSPTYLVSTDGKFLYSIPIDRRTVVDLKDLPKYVSYALIAAEDRRFYDHKGVDLVSLGGAVFAAMRDRHAGRGGSTISMQLAKNLINGTDRTPLRKLKDIATAQQIESLKSKDEILNLYANYAYYGEHAFGIQRAAQVYFGKDAKNLTIGEAAMLARSVRLPSRVNPIRDYDKMIGVRNYVVSVMRDEGWISPQEYEDAIHEVPKVKKSSPLNAVPPNGPQAFFVDSVLQQLQEVEKENPGVDFQSGGYRIETTLNFQLQKRATEAVAAILYENRRRSVNDGAIVVMDQYGHILAEVGGANHKRRQFNIVTTGKRQPGSAFKAILYATALRDGTIQPNSQLSNARIPYDQQGRHWDPENASRRENASSYSLETAFALSVNRPAINTIIKEDPANVVEAARDVFGFKSRIGANWSLALGTSEVKPLELLEAYSVFMLGGDRVEPQAILRIINPDGTVFKDYAPQIHRGALNPRIAQQMDAILKGPVSHGTATPARIVPNARGKTGTTNDAKDAWFCGYSDGLVGVGWVGNSGPKGESLKMHDKVFGGTVTVNIWTAVMLSAHRLGLAKGVKGSPGATISVEASPERRYVRPVRDREPQIERPERVVTDPNDETPAVTPPPADPPATEPDFPDEVPPMTEEPRRSDPPRRREAPVTEETQRPDPPRRRERPKPAEPEEVEVMICVDSGMKAGAYCPEIVTRRFPKGRAPRVRCTIHHG